MMATYQASAERKRSPLRRIFDKFDADGSGYVDTQEMAAIVAELQLDMTPAQIDQMIAEADLDGSGVIEYKEFATVIEKQLQEGGKLAEVVTEASATFGWLNPLKWFSSTEGEAPPSELHPGNQPYALTKSPKGSPSSPSGSKRKPTHKMKKTQSEVQTANADEALRMRAALDDQKRWFVSQQDHFLARQHEKVLKGHREAVETAEAIESVKQTKRELGSEMRKVGGCSRARRSHAHHTQCLMCPLF